MGSYSAYASYKDSGIEWLGKIPEHWELARFSHFIDFQEGPGIMAVDFKEQGVPLLRIHNLKQGFVDLEGCNFLDEEKVEKTWKHFKLKCNDLLISCSASTGLVSVVDERSENSIPYTGIIRLSPANSSIAREFIKTIVESELFFTQIELLKTGTTIQHYGPIHLRQIKITLPTLDEQRAIAAFLDYKTQQIDQLIAKKEALLEKLDEKRTALISHAVTKGLDPTVPMKDSGVEWLGDIPEHWETKKIQYIGRLKSGENIISQQIEPDGLYPVFGGNGIRGYFDSYNHDGHYILIGRQGALCGNINYANGKFWASEHAVVINPLVRFEVFWLGELLQIMNLNQYSTSAAQPGLSVEQIARLKIPFPPFNEQKVIAQYLSKKTFEIDRQKVKILQAIDLLKEYRTALITNAVTGKIDVRSVPIPTP